MKFYFTIILFCLTYSTIEGQNISVSGYVTDKKTGEKLTGANIYIPDNFKGTTTNDFGYYSLSLKKGQNIRLIVSYIGYQSESFTIYTSNDKSLNIELSPGDTLEEVIIKGNKNEPDGDINEISVISIPVETMKQLPVLGGETDLIKVLQLMPGVQSGNEGSSTLYVRGGSPDQNLILLDNVPLYYVNHLGGFVSIFNIDAINSVKLIKGGFPARYGGRISSIVNIQMKEGNIKKFQGAGMIGLIAAKISIEGPVKKDTTSYIISARRFLWDLLSKPISKIVFDGISQGYNFYDINAKINHKFSDKDRLFFSFYTGDDKLSVNLKEKNNNGYIQDINTKKWGNFLLALRYNHLYSPKLFSNLTLAYTHYRLFTKIEHYEHKNNYVKNSKYNYFSGVEDISLNLDYEYFFKDFYTLRFGISTIFHFFYPGRSGYVNTINNQNTADTSYVNYKTKSLESAIYIENDIRAWKNLNFNIGFRLGSYFVEKTSNLYPQPRITASYKVSRNTSLKAGFAMMQQSIHLLTNSGTGMPLDIWVPATKKIPSERSFQYTLGFAKTLINNRYEFNIETYYKELYNLITYKEGALFFTTADDWQNKVETNGLGISYGIEFLFKKKKGKTTGWIGYTWSKTTRQFPETEVNFGKPYPFRYDRRNDISIVIIHKFNKRIDCSVTWVYGSGYPITLAVEKYKALYNDMGITGLLQSENTNSGKNFVEARIYNGKNNFRMRDYHRLDVGFNFRKEKKWGERIWNISIYNLYNRQNPYYYYFGQKESGHNEDGTIKYEPALFQQSLFPFILSLSWRFSF